MTDEHFFEKKKPAAVLKHAVLNGYLPVFVQKTGSTSPGHVVVVVDGYAGEGRYENGEPGSPILILDVARRASGRNVHAIFVEANAKRHAKLVETLTREAGDATYTVMLGAVETLTAEILATADGVPVLLFLDPFGRGMPMEDIARLLTRDGALGSAKTEVLLNFSMVNIRRVGGFLSKAALSPTEATTLANTDAACGGAWWRETFRSASGVGDRDAAAEAVAVGFLERLCKASGCSGWTVDVRPRPDLLPLYHLQLFTRHQDGMVAFGEATSRAMEKWRKSSAAEYYEGDFTPSMLDAMVKTDEAQLKQRWVKQIRENCDSLLTRQGSFSPRDDYRHVFAGCLGEAREMHLRTVLQDLERTNSIPARSSVGLLYNGRVISRLQPQA